MCDVVKKEGEKYGKMYENSYQLHRKRATQIILLKPLCLCPLLLKSENETRPAENIYENTVERTVASLINLSTISASRSKISILYERRWTDRFSQSTENPKR